MLQRPRPDPTRHPFQQQRIEQYNITYEHELFSRVSLRGSYLGTNMHGLIAAIDPFAKSGTDFTPFWACDKCDPICSGNFLLVPSTRGVSLGIQKRVGLDERVPAAPGANFNNLFDCPLVASTDTSFANLGSIALDVGRSTGALQRLRIIW